jgi:hypothetical protein
MRAITQLQITACENKKALLDIDGFIQVIDVMFSSLVPLYNALVWISRTIFYDVFLDALVNNAPSVKAFGVATGDLCKHVALDAASYISMLAMPCDYAKEGDMCYEPSNNRVIDFITVMANVRTIATSVSRIALSVCASASAPINIAIFPLMDINLAKAVHNMANSVLYTIFQLPSVTAQRCLNHGLASSSNSTQRSGNALLMCLPDFNQPINMFVAGLRNLGLMVDNWFDVSSIIALRSMGFTDDQADCRSTAKSLTPAFYSRC